MGSTAQFLSTVLVDAITQLAANSNSALLTALAGTTTTTAPVTTTPPVVTTTPAPATTLS